MWQAVTHCYDRAPQEKDLPEGERWHPSEQLCLLWFQQMKMKSTEPAMITALAGGLPVDKYGKAEKDGVTFKWSGRGDPQ